MIGIRKFVTWMRRKHGYPETYPNRNKLTELLPLSKYAYDASRLQIRKPDRMRDAHTIPTDQEMEFLCNAAVNPRDKACIEMSREHGERIGGLGTRQIKHVKFDQLGAVVTIHDKTFKGERHNRNAKKFNLPQINKHITTHLFRYYAQTHDEYLQKKAGLAVEGRDNADKLVKCVRCKEINQAIVNSPKS